MHKRKHKGFVLITVLLTMLMLFTLTMLLASHVQDFSFKKGQTTRGIENRLVTEMVLDTITGWFCAKSGDLISDEDYEATIPKKNPVIAVPSNFFEPILACYGGRTITAEVTDCYYDDTYAETARKTAVPQIAPVTYLRETELSFHISVTVKDNEGNTLNATRMIKAIKNTETKEKRTFYAETYFF